MKKTYINPTTNVVKVNVAHHMMAGSETMGVMGNYGEGVTIGSRRGRNTYWEDDEE